MRDYRLLAVWSKAHELTLMTYKLTNSFPVDERFGLTSQMRRSAVSVSARVSPNCMCGLVNPNGDGVTANDGATDGLLPNIAFDYPVMTGANPAAGV